MENARKREKKQHMTLLKTWMKVPLKKNRRLDQ